MRNRNGTRSLRDLAGGIVGDAARLIALDLRLAAQHARRDARRIGIGVVLIGFAGVATVGAAALLLAAAVLGLATFLPAWAAALVAGGAVLLVAALLTVIGLAALRRDRPYAVAGPIRRLREDVEWLRSTLGSTK